LSIFEDILENIQRICQLCPIANGQNQLSVHPSRPYTTGLLPRPSSMTTLSYTIDSIKSLPIPFIRLPNAVLKVLNNFKCIKVKF
jgi:hypothetical protein